MYLLVYLKLLNVDQHSFPITGNLNALSDYFLSVSKGCERKDILTTIMVKQQMIFYEFT